MPSYANFRNKDRQRVDIKNPLVNPASRQLKKEGDVAEKYRNNLIDWATFYRRNMHRFIEHYFGIKLYPYQVIWIYMMSINDSFVAICSRAVGKSWLVGVFACAKAVLYPNSEIVIVSSTKEQAGIIVSDKITNLYNNYPNLAREISQVVTNMNKWQVNFHNGSVIKIVASLDSSRGRRSTLTLYEEFRLISKDVVDAVIRPFSYIRQPPYLKMEEYKHLSEEPKEIFISSAYHKGLWWYDETKKNIKAMMQGDNSGFIAIDYSVAIRYHIKTVRQIKNEMSKMDEITALEEYGNIPYSESSNSYFRLKMFAKARNIKRAFYPQRPENLQKKNPYAIPKVDGELRVISCDVAQKSGPKNDLSISLCIRLLPTTKGYQRQCVFIESFSGINSITQSLRIKQLFYDFEADYIVLDVGAGGGGLPMYDQLGIVSRDAERGVEYPAMTVMRDPSLDQGMIDELSRRTLGINALNVVYPISATAKSNSVMAISMRDALQKKLWNFLVDESSAEDYLIKTHKEFMSQDDPTAKSFLLSAYIQTSLLINEMINLDMSVLAGNIRLLPNNATGRRDRYSSISYGNFFISLLDSQLIREEDTDDSYQYMMNLIQSV